MSEIVHMAMLSRGSILNLLLWNKAKFSGKNCNEALMLETSNLKAQTQFEFHLLYRFLPCLGQEFKKSIPNSIAMYQKSQPDIILHIHVF